MTVFGPSWDDLTLDDVAAFLHDAPSEPLEWEAKSDWNPGAIRAAVCGFANSHNGGYLLLGVEKKKGEPWTIDGVKTPNGDPPSDVTDLIDNRGVTPFPDGLDVRSFAIDGGKHVAVVRVPPTPTPPCLTKGTVFERVSGKTIPVEDASRLASLFERGDAAQQAGVRKADRAANRALQLAGLISGTATQFGLALGAPGLPIDLTPRLFSTDLNTVAQKLMHELLIDEPANVPGQPQVSARSTQFELIYTVAGIDQRLGWDWLICLHREGSVGVHWTPKHSSSSIPSLVHGTPSPVGKAWAYAHALLHKLGLSALNYLQLRVCLPQPFPLDAMIGREGGTGPTDKALANIERELRRANGELIFETA